MGKPAARIGDRVQGICHHGYNDCPHPWQGSINRGANSVLMGGAPVARLGDKVSTNCPHCGTGTITEGSRTVLAEGIPVAHLGDRIITPAGNGTIVGGSSSEIID